MWGIGNKIYWGIKTGCNEAFVINGEKRAQLIAADPRSAEIIQPLAVGDDVRRWHVRDKGRYLIVTPIGVNISRYPAVFAHLQRYQERLEKRSDQGNHWWELRACDYYDAFDRPKIIYPDMAQEPRFTLDTTGYYFGNTTYLIANADLYLLGILNSQPFWSLCQQKFAVFTGGRWSLTRQFRA
ncbi:TaqI-like C-terminal specificity domain-containing protein [Deinococcus sp. PEB2-63]